MSKTDSMDNKQSMAKLRKKRAANLYVEFQDQELLLKFKSRCLLDRRSYKEVAEALIAKFVAGEVKVDID